MNTLALRHRSSRVTACLAIVIAGAACTAGQQLGEPAGDGGTSKTKRGDSSPQDGSKPGPSSSSGNDPNEDAAPAQLPAGAKRFFVSAGVHDGNLGGLAGADQRCTLAAEGANLGGNWKAL